MGRIPNRSTACTEFAEQEVLDRIRQRRLDADLRRAAAGGLDPEVGGRQPRTLRVAGASGAELMLTRVRDLLDRSPRPGSPDH